MSNQTTQASNRMTFDTMLKEAEALGAEHGKGKDSWSKFLYRVVEAGYLGAIDMTKDKHGEGIDDAHKLTEAWVKGQTGAVIYDHKTQNSRKAASCVRTCGRVGGWTKGGQGEPLGSLNNLLTMRGKAKANPSLAKNLDDPSNTILRWARAQLKRDNLIPEDEFKEFIFKKQPDLSTAEELIKAHVTGLTNLINGKASQGTAQDASSLVKDAVDKLKDRLAEIAKARTPVKSVTATKSKVA